MRRLAVIIIALAAIVTACQVSEDATAPKGALHVGNPVFDVFDNCTFDQARCDIIRAGIDFLLNHANESCRIAGQAALERFEAPASYNAGYRDIAQVEGLDMGVAMDGSMSTYSGWEPTSGYVDVYPSFWQGNTSGNVTGALLAHEEQHQNGMDGPDHRTGIAIAYQQSCMNPAP